MTFTKAIIIFALVAVSFNLLVYGAYRRTMAEAKRRAEEEDSEAEETAPKITDEAADNV